MTTPPLRRPEGRPKWVRRSSPPTLTTVAVFVPVVFLEGIAAQLFRDQALTVSFSLLAALAVSLTLIPVMAAVLTRDGSAAAPAPPDKPTTRLRRVLRAVLVAGPSMGRVRYSLAVGGAPGSAGRSAASAGQRLRPNVGSTGRLLPAHAADRPPAPPTGADCRRGAAGGLGFPGAQAGCRPDPPVRSGRVLIHRRAPGGHATGCHRPVPRRRRDRPRRATCRRGVLEHRRRIGAVPRLHRHRG